MKQRPNEVQVLTGLVLKAVNTLHAIAVNNDKRRELLASLRRSTANVLSAADDSQRLADDNTRGEYREEVTKLVDGVVEDIRHRHHSTQAAAADALFAACAWSPYATSQELQRITLSCSDHPSAYRWPHTTVDTSPIPWYEMACQALWTDSRHELCGRPEYQSLS